MKKMKNLLQLCTLALLCVSSLMAKTPQSPFYLNEKDGAKLQEQLDTPIGQTIAFDQQNIPYIYNLDTDYISTLKDGKWEKLDFSKALKDAKINWTSEREPRTYSTMSFDKYGDLYLLIPNPRITNGSSEKSILIYSKDKGKTFTAIPIPIATDGAIMENISGGSSLDNPPAIVCAKDLKKLPGEGRYRWARIRSINLFLPQKVGNTIELGKPIEISNNSFGLTPHSGGDSCIISCGDNVYVTYIKCPEDLIEGGNPTYVACINRKTSKMVDEQFVVSASPKWADCHSNPGLFIDNENKLHLITGAHYRGDMYYRKSKNADSIKEWENEVLTVGKENVYVAAVIDDNNTLHLTCRGPYYKLEYLCKADNDKQWSEPKTIALHSDKNTNYAVYYHHLFKDNKGNLYLAFTFKNSELLGTPKLFAYSNDNGKTWNLASTEFFKSQIDSKYE